MNRRRVLVGGAVVALVAALAVAVFVPPDTLSRVVGVGALVVALYSLLVVLYVLVAGGRHPLADVGPLVDPAPERTPREYPLVVDTQFDLERAQNVARRERDTEAGYAVVREPLERLLVDALVTGGHDRSTAQKAVREGTWTDDRAAAEVLSAEITVEPSLRGRLRAYLFPGAVVRDRTRRAVARVAETVGETVPGVVGQTAPRRIPVRPPMLEEQRRSATGEIEPASDSSFGYSWAAIDHEHDGVADDGTEGSA